VVFSVTFNKAALPKKRQYHGFSIFFILALGTVHFSAKELTISAVLTPALLFLVASIKLLFAVKRCTFGKYSPPIWW